MKQYKKWFRLFTLACCLLPFFVPNSAHAVSSSPAQSGTFTIDNRPQTGQAGLSGSFTLDNRTTYSGLRVSSLSSPHGSLTKHVYYLAGVSLDETFTATIDWNGATPSQLKWYRNSTLIATDAGNSNLFSRSFNVGTAFSAGDKLSVQAITSNGVASPMVTANFDVVPVPDLVPTGLLHVVLGNADLKYTSGAFSLRYPSFEASLPENEFDSEDNDEIRSIGDTTFSTLIEIEAEIAGDGTCHIKLRTDKLKKKDAFKVAGVGFDASVWVDLLFIYTNGQWQPGGTFGFTVNGKKDLGTKYWVLPLGPIPIPVFLKGVVEALVDGEFSFVCLEPGSGLSGLDVSGELSPELTLEVILGCGVSDVAAVEGYLKGGIDIEIQFPDKPTIKRHILILDGGVRAYVWSLKYENNMLHLQWPDDEPSPTGIYPTPLHASNFTPITRDYLANDYAQWQGGGSAILSMGILPAGGTAGTEVTLQTNIFSQSDAKLAVSGGKKCLVWLYDDPARNSLDRTMLVYSIHNGTSWSAPLPIANDGTADLMPDLIVDSTGRFTCVWSNAAQLIPDGTGLAGMAAQLDIQMAVYDSVANAWTTDTVANGQGLDYNPKVACDPAGVVTVVWIHDDNNDLLAENAPVTNSLLARRKAGSVWESIQTITTTQALVKYTDIVAGGTGFRVAYSLDQDSDLQTDTDNELYYASHSGSGWSATVQLTNDAVADVNPQWVAAPSGLMLLWARDGAIVSASDLPGLSDLASVVSQQGSSGQRDFVSALSPSGNISVVWNDPSSAGSDVFTATFDPTMSAWSQVVQVTGNRDMERSICAAYAAADRLELAYNKVHIVDGSGLGVFGQVDLCTYSYLIGNDLLVAANSLMLTDPNAAPGETVNLSATIVNAGDRGVSQPISVAFYLGTVADAAHQIGSKQTITAALAAGGQAQVTVPWTIPASVDPLMVMAVVDPDLAIEDKVRANNTLSQTFFGPDLSIDMTSVDHDADSSWLTVDISNQGYAQTGDYELKVTRSADGSALSSLSLGNLQARQGQTASLMIPHSLLAYGPNLLLVELVPASGIVEPAHNNQSKVIIQKFAPYDIDHDNQVNLNDLAILMAQWSALAGFPSADLAAPLDGRVDILDFAILSQYWMESLTGTTE